MTKRKISLNYYPRVGSSESGKSLRLELRNTQVIIGERVLPDPDSWVRVSGMFSHIWGVKIEILKRAFFIYGMRRAV